MKFWVQWGSHLAMGNGYSINKVNSRSFYVSTDGRQERYLLVEWEQWLARRFAEGKVLLDGELLEPPPPVLSIQGPPPGEVARGVDRAVRDGLFLAAAREVTASHDIELVEENEREVHYLLRGPGPNRRVFVRCDWSEPPRCDCPEAREQAAGGRTAWCKHGVAVLLQDENHRGQLLELLL